MGRDQHIKMTVNIGFIIIDQLNVVSSEIFDLLEFLKNSQPFTF